MTKLLLIIGIQLLYVPMLTLRTICMVKNLKILTALFGFFRDVDLYFWFGNCFVGRAEHY